MPAIAPISRRDLIRYLKQCGYEGPYPGGKHQYLRRDGRKAYIPNPLEGAITKPFLLKILKQAGISREEWESL